MCTLHAGSRREPRDRHRPGAHAPDRGTPIGGHARPNVGSAKRSTRSNASRTSASGRRTSPSTCTSRNCRAPRTASSARSSHRAGSPPPMPSAIHRPPHHDPGVGHPFDRARVSIADAAADREGAERVGVRDDQHMQERRQDRRVADDLTRRAAAPKWCWRGNRPRCRRRCTLPAEASAASSERAGVLLGTITRCSEGASRTSSIRSRICTLVAEAGTASRRSRRSTGITPT